MPDESEPHEGTWLAWPHDYTYGAGNRQFSEQVWIDMTIALTQGEKVYMIAYDQTEQAHIEQVLINNGVDMSQVEFYLIPTDDYWMRDNGPIFVYDDNNDLHFTDWAFNGWGNDAPFALDDVVPLAIANQTGMSRLDVSGMVMEGGSIEIDGHGAALLCRSSVTNSNRNPNLTEAQCEDYLTQYLGVEHFIWLDGTPGLEITDFHIDGFARFLDTSTIITMDSLDLIEMGTTPVDIQTLYSAQTMGGTSYQYAILPATQNNVSNFWGQPLGYKGSYVNFYVSNSCVLVPTYNDPNDQTALNIIQSWYPNRSVVGVDVTRIYEYGGMIHCITQQQPVALNPTTIADPQRLAQAVELYPNPATDVVYLKQEQHYRVFNATGQLVLTNAGTYIPVASLAVGVYTVVLEDGRRQQFVKR